MRKELANITDEKYSVGKDVVARDGMAYWLEKNYILVHRTTAGRAMKSTGLTWDSICKEKRTYAFYRIVSIRDFIITLDKYEKEIKEGNNYYIFVFIDESYVNTNHASKNEYLSTDKSADLKIDCKSGKYCRLTMLHVITGDSTLVDLDLTKIPVDDLKWKDNNCHPEKKGRW